MARKTSRKSEILFYRPSPGSFMVARCEPHGKNLDQAAAALLRTARRWHGCFPAGEATKGQLEAALPELSEYICKYGSVFGEKGLPCSNAEDAEWVKGLTGMELEFDNSNGGNLRCPADEKIRFFYPDALLDSIQTASFLANLYATSAGKKKFEEKCFEGTRRKTHEIELPLPSTLSYLTRTGSKTEWFIGGVDTGEHMRDQYRLNLFFEKIAPYTTYLQVSADTYHYEYTEVEPWTDEETGEELEPRPCYENMTVRNADTEDSHLARAAFIWCCELLLSPQLSWKERGGFEFKGEDLITHFVRLLIREGVDLCPYCGRPLIKVKGQTLEYCNDGCRANDNKKWKRLLKKTGDPEAVKEAFPHIDPKRVDEEMNLYR